MLKSSRALHYVLKVGNLKKNIEFFRDTLGMTVLRHEVFDKGCDAACNGPYDGKWSKTMIGYGPEDDHFVLELTYNYSIGSYKLGNDLQYIRVALGVETYSKLDAHELKSPDGYKFILEKLETPKEKQDVTEVCLSCKDLAKSVKYWVELLNMTQCGGEEGKEAILRYAEDQATLRLSQIDDEVDHKTAYGRIAFSCPSEDLKPVQKASEDADHKVLTQFVSLDTPGKATVQVVILADPDGHEICFVGDEGFRDLSQVDPEANDLIEKSMEEDKSEEWFHKRKIAKKEA